MRAERHRQRSSASRWRRSAATKGGSHAQSLRMRTPWLGAGVGVGVGVGVGSELGVGLGSELGVGVEVGAGRLQHLEHGLDTRVARRHQRLGEGGLPPGEERLEWQ